MAEHPAAPSHHRQFSMGKAKYWVLQLLAWKPAAANQLNLINRMMLHPGGADLLW